MAFLVGLDCDGAAAVYDVRNRTTKLYDVGEIDATLANVDNVLQKLCKYVQPTKVQRLVISHFLPYPLDLQLARQKAAAHGFTNIHFVYWMSTFVQAIVNKKLISSGKNEYVLVTVRYGVEFTTLWRFANNEMKFIPSLASSKISNTNFVADAQNVTQSYGVHRWFVFNSPDTRNLIRSSNLAVHVVQWDQKMTSQQLALVALWNAQRRTGVVEGMLVENYHRHGPRIEVDGTTIRDKVSEGVAMPSTWISKYVTVSKNITVYHNIAQWKFNFQTKEIVKIQLCFDEDGMLEVKLMAPQTASIAIRNEHMYMVASATDNVPDPPVIGPFPTRLRFEKEFVTVSENVFGQNILSGILKMLDPSNPAEPGWQLVNNRFTAAVRLPDGTDKEIDAQTAASHLLSFAVNKIPCLDERLERFIILVPEEFTDKQCESLINAASNIAISATIKTELDAVADGYAKKQNLQDEDRVIVMHPAVSGCKLKLFKVYDQKTELEAEKFDAKMNCEVLRQNQQRWEKRVHDSINPMDSGASRAKIFQLCEPNFFTESNSFFFREHSSYSIAEVPEHRLDVLRSMLQTLVPDGKRDKVKGVILVGADARRLPLLNNLLCWIFPSAKVCTLVEEEVQCILRHWSPQFHLRHTNRDSNCL